LSSITTKTVSRDYKTSAKVRTELFKLWKLAMHHFMPALSESSIVHKKKLSNPFAKKESEAPEQAQTVGQSNTEKLSECIEYIPQYAHKDFSNQNVLKAISDMIKTSVVKPLLDTHKQLPTYKELNMESSKLLKEATLLQILTESQYGNAK
jgi:hypothetical protein